MTSVVRAPEERAVGLLELDRPMTTQCPWAGDAKPTPDDAMVLRMEPKPTRQAAQRLPFLNVPEPVPEPVPGSFLRGSTD